VEGKGVERTPGAPVTVTRVWDLYHGQINAAATRFAVPAQLIVATICTESSGRADAIRLEPRFVSDAATPDQVTPGLMQTLISTARVAMNNPNIDRKWLFVPGNSIMAGTAYIASQAGATLLDPPLVAAGCNAGSLRHNMSPKNRWKLVQFPLDSSEHCDRFVKWFNDACFALARHPIAPTVGLERLIGIDGARRLDARKIAAARPERRRKRRVPSPRRRATARRSRSGGGRTRARTSSARRRGT
jgi:hypothetical protein